LVEQTLAFFEHFETRARLTYCELMRKGVEQGHWSELVGSGLLRIAGG
jgi:hypothetical protein